MNTKKTSTRTFGKTAAKEAKEFFEGKIFTKKQYGNSMYCFINFYDKNKKNIGYFSNEGKVGHLRKF